MDKIKLTKPTIEYADDILQFRQEILDANDPDAFAGCGNLEECKTAQEWIDWITVRENPETCPEGRVPSNIFIAVRVADDPIDCVVQGTLKRLEMDVDMDFFERRRKYANQ